MEEYSAQINGKGAVGIKKHSLAGLRAYALIWI